MLSKEPKFHYTGKIAVRDAKNRLTARVTFADSHTAAELKACWGKKPGPNDVRVQIVKTLEDQEFSLLEGRGNWARYLQFEDKLYWRVGDPVDTFIEDGEERSLPSAAHHRKELQLIAQKRYSDADKILESLELSENKDALLRRKRK